MSVNNFPSTFDLATPSFIITDTTVQKEILGNIFSQGSPEVGVIDPVKAFLYIGQEIPREFTYIDTNASPYWAYTNDEAANQLQSSAFTGAIETLLGVWRNFWIGAFNCPFVIVYDVKVDFLYSFLQKAGSDASVPNPSDVSYLRYTFKILPFTINPELI